jgi:hypothetical protein
MTLNPDFCISPQVSATKTPQPPVPNHLPELTQPLVITTNHHHHHPFLTNLRTQLMFITTITTWSQLTCRTHTNSIDHHWAEKIYKLKSEN